MGTRVRVLRKRKGEEDEAVPIREIRNKSFIDNSEIQEVHQQLRKIEERLL